jgi:hypothetical protein
MNAKRWRQKDVFFISLPPSGIFLSQIFLSKMFGLVGRGCDEAEKRGSERRLQAAGLTKRDRLDQ